MANPPPPFAVLLQASEMASQESSRASRKTHTRNTHSLSSLPTIPHRHHPHSDPRASLYATPSRQTTTALKIPSTAPLPRTSALRGPDTASGHPRASYQHIPTATSRHTHHPPAPASEGTVSASDNDSEAETDILDPDEATDEDEEVDESHASRAASQMLRSSQVQQAQRASFQGGGMLGEKAQAGLKQSRLFGAVRKAGVEREEEEGRPAKKTRTGGAVGLGIAGLRG